MIGRNSIFVAAIGLVLAIPAYAEDKPVGAPAASSGAPKDAAEHGSSEAGKDASVNENKSQEATREENSKMSDPNKGNK